VARPRKASDEEIFQAAFGVMQRRGPTEWTLADVASEVGLTAGALVQRFGSKRELLLALTRLYADGVPQMYADLQCAACIRQPIKRVHGSGASMA